MPKLNFKYYIDYEYEPKYVNGVYGGINPQGEIIANFYLERVPIPYEEEVALNDELVVEGDPVIVEPDDFKIRRAIQTGIIMSKDNALVFYHWLKNVLKDAGVEDDSL